jgi:predicted O-methyltransferase YrrM
MGGLGSSRFGRADAAPSFPPESRVPREPVGTVAWKQSRPRSRRALESALRRLVALGGFRLERLERAQKFGTDDATALPSMLSCFEAIPGMVSLQRGLLLYLLAYATASEGDVVEIGSWQGRSTAFLAQACEDTDNGVVHAIDWFGGSPVLGQVPPLPRREMEQAMRANIERAGLAHRVVLHPKRSQEAREEVRAPVRMLFIDGEHTHEAVSSDLEYAELLAPGGLLVLDDFSDAFPGVVSAARAFLQRGGFARPFQGRGFLVTRRIAEGA